MTVAWLASYCVTYEGGQWKRTCFVDNNGQPYTPPQSDGYRYSVFAINGDTREEACHNYIDQLVNETYRYEYSGVTTTGGSYGYGLCSYKQYYKSNGALWGTQNAPLNRGQASNCPAGWYKTPAGCLSSLAPQPLTVQQVEEEMATKPLPQQLPPGFPYPLDPQVPFIFNPDQATPPNAQPLRVPQGNPVPIPNTNPQQYRQPVTRFTPAPTVDDPFRLDVRPEDLTGTSPTGLTGPTTVTSGSPAGDKPEQFDLCKEHPDILACQKIDFDTPDGEIPKENRQITYAPENVLGGGSCPPPRDLAYGRQFSYATTCDALTTYVRPMVIAIAGWMAIVIIFSIGKPE